MCGTVKLPLSLILSSIVNETLLVVWKLVLFLNHKASLFYGCSCLCTMLRPLLSCNFCTLYVVFTPCNCYVPKYSHEINCLKKRQQGRGNGYHPHNNQHRDKWNSNTSIPPHYSHKVAHYVYFFICFFFSFFLPQRCSC